MLKPSPYRPVGGLNVNAISTIHQWSVDRDKQHH